MPTDPNTFQVVLELARIYDLILLGIAVIVAAISLS